MTLKANFRIHSCYIYCYSNVIFYMYLTNKIQVQIKYNYTLKIKLSSLNVQVLLHYFHHLFLLLSYLLWVYCLIYLNFWMMITGKRLCLHLNPLDSISCSLCPHSTCNTNHLLGCCLAVLHHSKYGNNKNHMSHTLAAHANYLLDDNCSK